MREIKFRAYSNDTKTMYPYAIQWFNWELWVHKNNSHNWEWKNIWCGNDEDIVDYSYKLMQFTWLLDKNGKEIYDWDIVEWKQAEWWILESSIDTNVYICKIDWFMNWWACRLNDGHCWFTLWSSHMTVVGNIYENENPDLITN